MGRKLSYFGLAIILFLSMFVVPTQVDAAAKNLEVHFIDVKQGDAVYIKTPSGQNIVIDGGNRAKGHDVVAYLKKQKVKTIDYVIATHPDADHIGGLDEVINAFKVKNVYAPKVSHTTQAYKDFLNAVKKKKLKIKTAKAGVKLPLKGKNLQATFIGPVKNYAKSDLNNWSAVLHVKYNRNTFLFTGDAEQKSEKDMLAQKSIGKIDVLKVSHHGASNATTENFLKKTKPKYAVISVGKNKYKHPTSATLKRLKNAKAKVYRTDQSGTVKVTSNGKTLKFTTTKKTSTKSTTPSKNTSSTSKKENTTSTNATKNTTKLTATLDKKTPKQNGTVNLTVSGLPKGTTYTAVFHYKSKKTTYKGKVGTKLPVKIGRAAKGYKVKIDVTAKSKNKTYKASTSFTPK